MGCPGLASEAGQRRVGRPIYTRGRRLRLRTRNVRRDWVGVRAIRQGLYFLYTQQTNFCGKPVRHARE
ncbi:hypothetical protein sS8_0378 [Methylocaldum marinum]|uniref:Uncharacterized protein n=1 Tax=Methylocaldum marinum TaxID=1432792 RepID=A0A286P3X4_9GAMM|nr:hypothetical protein sS8_0378 [Methylocaldum marinum]